MTYLAVTGSGHIVMEEGAGLTARTNLDFVGAGVSATDNAGGNKTIVTIPGPTSGPLAVSTKSAAYTLVSGDDLILADATSAAFTLTLLTAVGNTGKVFYIKRINAGANNVTIATTSSQTIDGSTTVTLASQWAEVTVASNGSNWVIIGVVL